MGHVVASLCPARRHEESSNVSTNDPRRMWDIVNICAPAGTFLTAVLTVLRDFHCDVAKSLPVLNESNCVREDSNYSLSTLIVSDRFSNQNKRVPKTKDLYIQIDKKC